MIEKFVFVIDMKFNIIFLDVKENVVENFDNFSINIEKLFLN